MHRIESNDAGAWSLRTAGLTTACVSRRSYVHGGFTLVEVLVAVALLSVGLLAVLTAGQAGRETQQRAVYLSAARTVAQTRIDQALARQYNALASLAGTETDPSLPRGNSVTVTVAQFTNALGQPDPDLTSIGVTVTWPEAEGTRSIVYETLIANPN